MFTHALDERTHLALLEKHHAAGLLAVVDANRDHLRPWLDWVDGNRTVQDSEAFIRLTRERWSQGTMLAAGIWHDGALVGVIDFHNLRTSQGTAEIGYWLAAGHQGKGLMTKACRAMIDHGFGTLGLRRITIQCATANTRSQAIPERLGFTREGVLREVMIVNGSPVDHALYAMLAREWAHDR